MTWKVPAKSSNDDGDFYLAPEGNHPAVCVAVIDLGTQRRKKFQSEDYEDQRQVYIAWELVEEGQVIGREFKVSLHEKAGLRKFVDQWIGKLRDGEEFDLESLLGKTCLLTVTHKQSGDKTYHRIDAAAALPRIKGKVMEIGKATHKPYSWTLDSGTQPSLPPWLPRLYGEPLAEVLAACREHRQASAGAAPADEGEVGDEPPF